MNLLADIFGMPRKRQHKPKVIECICGQPAHYAITSKKTGAMSHFCKKCGDEFIEATKIE
jgi:hypothetical protein